MASNPTTEEAAVPDLVPTVEILEHHQTRSPWSLFQRILYRLHFPDGHVLTQEREFLDRGDAVALLPYCPETGTVLLVRQFRMPVYLKDPARAITYEVCGGILDHPDPEVTLRHEAQDELGLTLGSVEPVFAAFSSPGSLTEKVHYFLAPYHAAQRTSPGGGLLDEGEHIQVVELPFPQALEHIRTGRIEDARTIALLYFLAATGRLLPRIRLRILQTQATRNQSTPSPIQYLSAAGAHFFTAPP